MQSRAAVSACRLETKMMSRFVPSGRSPRLGLIAILALGVALAATGCTQIRTHQGYIVDTDLVNSVQPGVDNRQSVLQTLGKPTFAAQFEQGDWYYLARDSKNYGFRNPTRSTRSRSTSASIPPAT